MEGEGKVGSRQRKTASSLPSLLENTFPYLSITFHSPYSEIMLKYLLRLVFKPTAAKPL